MNDAGVEESLGQELGSTEVQALLMLGRSFGDGGRSAEVDASLSPMWLRHAMVRLGEQGLLRATGAYRWALTERGSDALRRIAACGDDPHRAQLSAVVERLSGVKGASAEIDAVISGWLIRDGAAPGHVLTREGGEPLPWTSAVEVAQRLCPGGTVLQMSWSPDEGASVSLVTPAAAGAEGVVPMAVRADSLALAVCAAALRHRLAQMGLFAAPLPARARVADAQATGRRGQRALQG